MLPHHLYLGIHAGRHSGLAGVDIHKNFAWVESFEGMKGLPAHAATADEWLAHVGQYPEPRLCAVDSMPPHPFGAPTSADPLVVHDPNTVFVEHHLCHAMAATAFQPETALKEWRRGGLFLLSIDTPAPLHGGEWTASAAYHWPANAPSPRRLASSLVSPAADLWTCGWSSLFPGQAEETIAGCLWSLADPEADEEEFSAESLLAETANHGVRSRLIDPAKLCDWILDPVPSRKTLSLISALAAWWVRQVLDAVERLLRESPTPVSAVFAGGLAFDSPLLQTEWCRRFPGIRLVTPPCAHDSGAALGAACSALLAQDRIPDFITPFLQNVSPDVRTETDLANSALDLAGAISEYRLLGVSMDRGELGTRSLGHRAVLAIPSPETAAVLRRPPIQWPRADFTSLIREEDLSRWVITEGLPLQSLYGRLLYRARPALWNACPASVDAHGYAALQTVSAARHPCLHRVLSLLESRLSEAPCLLNLPLASIVAPLASDSFSAEKEARRLGLNHAWIQGTLLSLHPPEAEGTSTISSARGTEFSSDVLFMRLLRVLAFSSVAPIALYGAGTFTRRQPLSSLPSGFIGAILDDYAGDGVSIHGIPVTRAEGFDASTVKAVVIASTRFTDSLDRRARQLFGPGAWILKPEILRHGDHDFLLLLYGLVASDNSRIALFGCGQFTRRQLLGLLPPDRIVAILDDQAVVGQRWMNIPVIRPEALDRARVNAIVIATDSQGEAIYRRCQAVFGDTLPVIRPFSLR